MSRDDNGYKPEERTARALERIADSVDDFLDLTLATVGMGSEVGVDRDPYKAFEYLRKLADDIQARRASRGR